MSKRISKRVREEAAMLLQMSASASAVFDGDSSRLAFVCDVEQWGWFSSDARVLAQTAIGVCCGRHNVRPWHLRDACEKAEAASMLLDGWSPS